MQTTMFKPTTQTNIEEIPAWLDPALRQEAETLLAQQPDNACRVRLMNLLFSDGCSIHGDHHSYTPLPRAPVRQVITDWFKREYFIVGEDAGPQRPVIYEAFAQQKSYTATRCWTDKVFRKSVELCELDPKQTSAPTLLSATHLAINGYWDVCPKYADISQWPHAQRVLWTDRTIYQLHHHMTNQPEWTRLTLLMDPVYYENGLLLWCKMRYHSVETPFAGLTADQKLAWLKKRRAAIRKEGNIR